MKFTVACCSKFGARVRLRAYRTLYNPLLFFYSNYSACVETKSRLKIAAIPTIMKIEVRNLNVGVRIQKSIFRTFGSRRGVLAKVGQGNRIGKSLTCVRKGLEPRLLLQLPERSNVEVRPGKTQMLFLILPTLKKRNRHPHIITSIQSRYVRTNTLSDSLLHITPICIRECL